jgi:hypothetical protein
MAKFGVLPFQLIQLPLSTLWWSRGFDMPERGHKKKLLDEVAVIIKMGDNGEEGRRGQRTLQNWKN